MLFYSANLRSILMINSLLTLILIISCESADPKQINPLKAPPYRDVSGTHLKSTALEQNSMAGSAIDIDRDGDMDMVIACEFCPNVLLINDGTGVLSDESNQRLPRTNHDSEDMVVSDFDSDGDLDILFVSEDDHINEYFENTGNAQFVISSRPLPGRGTSNVVKGADLDSDGDVDLIIGNAGQNFVWINEAGDFKDETQQRLPGNDFTTQDLEFADIDQDGDLDLIEANETFNRILLNDGTGIFIYEGDRLPLVDDQTRDVEVGDLDNDGDPDIYFANVNFGGHGDPQNRLLLNDGSGFFQEATDRIPKSDFRSVDSNMMDIDLDGDLDLLVGNRFNGLSMMVFINDGEAHFSDHAQEWLPPMNVYPFDFQETDFNGDGKKDLYFCNFRGQDKLLFRE